VAEIGVTGEGARTDRDVVVSGLAVLVRWYTAKRTPGSMISGTEPQRKASTGVAAAMASIIDNPNGSGQPTGNSNALAPPRKPVLARSSISPTYSTPG
jgi:hypothetical protein